MHNFQQRREKDPKHKRIALKGRAYTEFRKKLAERAREHCENPKCGVYAPRLWHGHFNLYWSRGSGGDDVLSNVRWL